jgi:hypothetical protein
MRWAVRIVTGLMVTIGAFAVCVQPASATTTGAPPHEAIAGFSSPTGDAFSVAFADGSVRPVPFGDAFSLRLSERVTDAAPTPEGDGYWEVTTDGNVFSYGSAGAFGGLGGIPLSAPVFAIAPTKSGNGYLLAARDGGVFAFGDATFRGSVGARHLSQPIVGMTFVPGEGYRLVGRDGGIFSFGTVSFAGSLPGRHVRVSKVVGMASTPSGDGYWIARSSGQVYAFGDAQRFGGVRPPACDPITAIISNPDAQGYRLVTDSGRTTAFGDAPGGPLPTGAPRQCGHATARIELSSTTIVAGSAPTAYLVVDNETGHPLNIRTPGRCLPKWAITLSSTAIPNKPAFSKECQRRPLTLPVGESQRAVTLPASYGSGPLPPGSYFAGFFDSGGSFPAVAPVAVTIVAPS